LHPPRAPARQASARDTRASAIIGFGGLAQALVTNPAARPYSTARCKARPRRLPMSRTCARNCLRRASRMDTPPRPAEFHLPAAIRTGRRRARVTGGITCFPTHILRQRIACLRMRSALQFDLNRLSGCPIPTRESNAAWITQ
jgi:hypothetical protein